MSENSMDNRGSKSTVLINIVVKEQRVDGSCTGAKPLVLRCTLRGFERNLPINNPSKLINKKFFSTSTTDKNSDDFICKMNPGFFTGFSSFMIYIQKTNNTQIGWASWVSFERNLSGKDLYILKSIKSYLKVGTINQKSKGSCVYYLRRLPDISILIDHFDKYPLLTQKYADYLLFKSAYNILKKKEHLTYIKP